MLSIYGENGLDNFGPLGISQFENEDSSKTKMDAVTILLNYTYKPKTAYLWRNTTLIIL